MAFQGWSFPRGFSPEPLEVVSLQEGESPGGETHGSGGQDLPGALIHPVLTTAQMETLMGFLRQEGAPALARLPVERILKAVDRVARRLRDPMDPLRLEALTAVRGQAGYSLAMATRVLDGMSRDWARSRLEALLQAEFPDPGVLDGFCPGPGGSRVRARGYPLVFHLGAGSVPGVTATSMIRALLVKSASLVRPGRGDVALPVLLARALGQVDPDVGQALAVAYWPESQGPLTLGALRGSELVVVYGGDDTLAWVRSRTPATTALQGYRHRLGVGVVGPGALSGNGPARAAARNAAEAVALFDQRGCVSPHLFLVAEGGAVAPGEWARLLASALEALERTLPSGPLTGEEGAALQQSRGGAEVEESLGRGFVLHGGEEAPWTVHFTPDPSLEVSCLNRVVRVIPVDGLEGVPRLLKPWERHLQTVGVEGLGEEEEGFLDALAALGVSRITPLASVPWPPAWWHHDGAGPLRALIRWTDREASQER